MEIGAWQATVHVLTVLDVTEQLILKQGNICSNSSPFLLYPSLAPLPSITETSIQTQARRLFGPLILHLLC